MCGRFSLAPEADVLAELFPGLRVPPDYVQRYNIAPTQQILGLVRTREGLLYQQFGWGLVPHWATDASSRSSMINARAESVAVKPAFRSPFRRQRCLILADGFYEWRAEPGRRTKTPYHIRMREGHPFAFAGLWERWQPPAGAPVLTAAIITTEANTVMRAVHDRMPVILPPEEYEAWLDCDGPLKADSLQGLLRPCPDDLLVVLPVSMRVNNPRNEGPDLVSEAVVEPMLGYDLSEA